MTHLSRRDFLWQSGGGLGGVALSWMLGEGGALADTARPRSELNGGLHHKAKVRRIIQLFMNGGVSQMDTFDYKPELIKRHGEKVDFGLKAAATSVPGSVMKCPFEWKQYGQTGRWVSGVFPRTAECVDELAFLMAMQSKTNVHGPGSYMQNTGFLTPGFPSMGAWISYGLGRLTDNLPAYVVLPSVTDTQRGGIAADNDLQLTQPDLFGTRATGRAVVGYDLGILTPQIFAMMVLMALATTAMTGPLLSLSLNWGRRPALASAGSMIRSS